MASYADTQQALIVDRVPFFASGSITSGNTATITFDNLTDQVEVTCLSLTAGVLRVGVTTTGVGSTERVTLGATAGLNSSGLLDVRLKQVVLKADGGDATYQVFAVLSRTASSIYPDITTANGFAGV